jgi:hypothetical protein
MYEKACSVYDCGSRCKDGNCSARQPRQVLRLGSPDRCSGSAAQTGAQALNRLQLINKNEACISESMLDFMLGCLCSTRRLRCVRSHKCDDYNAAAHDALRPEVAVRSLCLCLRVTRARQVAAQLCLCTADHLSALQHLLPAPAVPVKTNLLKPSSVVHLHEECSVLAPSTACGHFGLQSRGSAVTQESITLNMILADKRCQLMPQYRLKAVVCA